jgi:ABC-2 type transport system permease protein
MNRRTVFSIVRKDLTTGPRAMLVVWVIVFPLAITLVIRLIFGGLINPLPKLGIVDQGNSSITVAAAASEIIEVTVVDSTEELRKSVESNDLDAGLILQPGFDSAVKSGESPQLQFFISGESLASDRIILVVTALDLIRGVAGLPAPIVVETEIVGDGPTVPLIDRLVPMLVLLAVALSAVFLPAASLIQERESRTLTAMLTTPARVGEFMFAKGIVAFLLSFISGIFTAVLNLGFSEQFFSNLAVILVAAFMCVPIGLGLGAAVKNMSTMFAIWKSGAIILFAPAILMLFPSVPRWVSMLFPTYYFLGPLYELNIEALALREVLPELGIGLLVGVALAAGAGGISGKMEKKLAVA